MPDLGWPELIVVVAVAGVVAFVWTRLPDRTRGTRRPSHPGAPEVDRGTSSPGARDLFDSRQVPPATRLSVDEAHEAVVRADDRVAEADAEVARLRAELVRRRNQRGSH
ncbi:hypothetical protein GCM10009868_00940 [Terrabacter aerolatus]|uniref:Uncharacterized protein n=1 Tax=Terrabacter aerolatus TaxID=422442 RepID=A0A512D3T5_9MICO|nr:hypothetical protein [Terrabacter aerolatus]GEO30930.1 hypothetical protein TAE01_27400 [Terrabacter aerolatus]